MSLAPTPTPRRSLHLRRISCEAFEREDGLFEIEGLLVDTKPTAIRLLDRREIPAGDVIHQMRVRLTADRERLIVDVRVYSEHHPYKECVDIENAYRQLVGVRVEPGFTLAVKRLFRGVKGCTHMSELIPPMASTLLQALWAESDFSRTDPESRTQRVSPIGGCHALRPEGEIVARYIPLSQKKAIS
jgi:Protein of unknown function (DUF2889)